MKLHQLFIIAMLALVVSCSQKEQSEKQSPNSQSLKAPSSQAQSENDIPIAEEDFGRTEWQNPQLVLSSIGELSGKVVADIGAGSGYFSFKMAQTAQKVIALDIDPKALEYIDNQIEIVGKWAKKIETRLTPAERPNLTRSEVDAVLIVNTYFYIPNRQNYLHELFECIRENGKLVIVEYKIGEMAVGPSDDFKITPEIIEKELRKSGFKSVNVDLQSLQYQFVISAEKR